MALHEVLAVNLDDVIVRWKAQVRGTLAPETMSTFELVDHIPRFVEEIVTCLKANTKFISPATTSKDTKTAAGHGAQRLRLGFSLDSVVREYGALSDAIISSATASGAEITVREFQVLFDAIIAGIAHAVTEYSHQRDAELLRQANEHFAFIAHELRDPLSSAMIAFKLLKTSGGLPENSRSVGAVERGLEQTSDLIDETLQVARVASGIELRRQSTSLKDLIGEAELASIAEADAKGVTIRLVIETDDRVDLDIRLVRSALNNILRNGVKYTPSGGNVEVRGRIVNENAVIEVEDCCGGLAPGQAEKAFAPFVRMDTAQSGFGLGLAIAKQAVVAHGGNIRVQNLPGKGCIFVLELPVGIKST
jgi:signal transduction histidine kinase